LLDVSRISAGRLTLNLEDVDLAALTKEVAERFEHVAERAGSPVVVRANAAIIVQCDRSRIDQSITNLLANAIKYGRGQPIDVSVEPRGYHVVIVVRDRGIGIDPQDQGRIFGRFERAASARHYGGLGLGLWIVSQIAEAHGGSVRVKSAAGEGSTFEIELPLRVTPAQ
jgi:signal transduction histidine kinase